MPRAGGSEPATPQTLPARPRDFFGPDGWVSLASNWPCAIRVAEVSDAPSRWRVRWPILVAMIVAVGTAGYVGWALWNSRDRDAGVQKVVVLPPLSAVAEGGRAAYDRLCAQCHGLRGGGSDKGPALVHPVYRPAHHADVAFKLAVRRGVRAHHWRFGDMPPQPDVSAGDLEAIVQYIREVQRANGIE